ncbi:MAG: rod shape-determining protein RodA [Parvibaculum sp.]|uniref:rod shape-determining protein RodA n=1 Tax=Parvibaculum sp. TaxID=2024848 RepID=UPI001D83EEAE|nr:rod shape-determining protein RodA [Parvibaculum sp.]MBX3488537.1 rod shape-determining protein RodA [Parvibaculum sp.]MBX3496814.1 rod shape-determining protein RodA [Parvibaculum sp.]MCW5727535.1 rod shape-determining protein RodA [Parvibaculum sp.]
MLDLRRFTGRELRLTDKLVEFNWGFLLLLVLIASIGFAMLYSVAEGSFSPWAYRQALRFAAGVCILLIAAMIDLRLWMRLAYPLYGVALAMLVAVEVVGMTGMGAQRWLNLGFVQIQPSEIMKVTLLMALARYFHGLTLDEVSRLRNLVIPVALIAAPVGLVVLQPDLGTAILLIASGAILLFAAGLRWRYFILSGALVLAAVPVVWGRLHDYQKNRVFTFLDPERDPLGTGYHILQSKIALGAGGVFGKGFMEGTQSQLNFLPEKHTDFIFTMLGEELGLAGGLVLLALYFIVLMFSLNVAMQCRNQFGRLLAIGVSMTFFLYVFINTAMVMGLLPVVGVPLPLVSYGGTAMLSLMFAFGLLMSVHIHRNVEISRGPSAFW